MKSTQDGVAPLDRQKIFMKAGYDKFEPTAYFQGNVLWTDITPSLRRTINHIKYTTTSI